MKDLVTLLKRKKLKDVTTYIQSGNIFFSSDINQSDLPKYIHDIIQDAYGYDVPVIVRNNQEIDKLFKNNPYPTTEIEDLARCHITFLSETPTKDNIATFNDYPLTNESHRLIGKDIYLQIEGKYHLSKLSNKLFESKLKVRATTRNWKTMIKLQERLLED